MKKNNGITLIALIITIIIMLILVAVSISILINSGIIGKAQKAKQDTQVAYEQEQRLGDSINANGVMYNSIDDIVNAGNSELHSWTRSGDTFTCSHCNTTLTMGQKMNYTAGGTGTASISAEMSGHSESQTISRDVDTTWVVLGREDTNKDGNFETLLLTTESPTTETIRLYGAASYNNWVGEANRIAKDLYGNDARGMTIEDINECLNYIPTEVVYYDGSANQTIGNFTTKLRDLSIWNSLKTGGTYTPDGRNTEEALGEYELNGYWYVADSNPGNGQHNITTIEKNVVLDDYYWLASTGLLIFDPTCVMFGPGSIWGTTVYSYGGYFRSNGNKLGDAFGFRAVVSLTTDIPSAFKD